MWLHSSTTSLLEHSYYSCNALFPMKHGQIVKSYPYMASYSFGHKMSKSETIKQFNRQFQKSDRKPPFPGQIR